MPPLWSMVVAWYAVMSAATFVAFARDKRAAVKGGRGEGGGWRTPEKTLHVMELLGGWPGALLGQQALRHKSRKRSYRLTLWAIAVLHGVGWGLLLTRVLD